MKKNIFAAFAAATILLSTNVFAQEESPKPKAEKQRISLAFSKFDKEKEEYKSIWPFATPNNKTILTDKASAYGAGQVTTCKMSEKKGGWEFDILSKNGILRNAKFGLRWGGEAGNYITLPAVEGKKLVSVSIYVGKEGFGGKPQITDMEGKVIKGGEVKTEAVQEGGKISFKVRVAAGKACKIVLTGDEEACYRKISLTYVAPQPK